MNFARVLCAAVVAFSAQAQAWIPSSGEGSVSIVYQHYSFTGHYASTGEVLHLGGAESQGIFFEAEYGLTDRLALNASVPYIVARNGNDPSPVLGHSGIDDGRYHGAWQNFGFGLRYQAIREPVVLTPFVELSIPTHDYPTVGEAAVGRGLQEFRIGVNAGRRLDPWLPRVIVEGRYAHAFAEELLGVSTDRDNVDLHVGFYINDRWSARVGTHWQQTNGGLNFPDDVLHDHELFAEHDRILDDDHLRAGTGVSFAINETISVDAGYVRSLRGSNTHVGHGITLGVTWAFQR